MKLSLAIIFLVVVVAVIALRARRKSGPDGYRRRFQSRYRHDASEAPDSSTGASTMFVVGMGDSGSHQHHAHGHHAHGSMDCGVHGGHADGGATGCGDGGAN